MVARLLCLFLLLTTSAVAQKPAFTVGWSIYAGWTPYHYLVKSGILKKWADKYGVTIKVQRFDYAPSLDAFVARNIDACAMTNMEALDMPAASGVPTTVLIIGDYSNGNDALLVRGIPDVKGLKGTEVSLVELSVSHYLLARALEMHGLKEAEIKVVNTSDSDIAP